MQILDCGKVAGGAEPERGEAETQAATSADEPSPLARQRRGSASSSPVRRIFSAQRRAGGFVWPPQKENYVWEALQTRTSDIPSAVVDVTSAAVSARGLADGFHHQQAETMA